MHYESQAVTHYGRFDERPKERVGKDFIPAGEPHAAGNRGSCGGFPRDGFQLGARREMGGTEGGDYTYTTGTGRQPLPPGRRNQPHHRHTPRRRTVPKLQGGGYPRQALCGYTQHGAGNGHCRCHIGAYGVHRVAAPTRPRQGQGTHAPRRRFHQGQTINTYTHETD